MTAISDKSTYFNNNIFGLKDDNLCSFCNNSVETIIHILWPWKYPKVQELLDNFPKYEKESNEH